MSWSAPFYGVQHMGGLRPGWRVSMTDRGSVSTAYVIAPGGGFTPCAEHIAQTPKLARQWCEEKARQLDAVAPGGAR